MWSNSPSKSRSSALILRRSNARRATSSGPTSSRGPRRCRFSGCFTLCSVPCCDGAFVCRGRRATGTSAETKLFHLVILPIDVFADSEEVVQGIEEAGWVVSGGVLGHGWVEGCEVDAAEWEGKHMYSGPGFDGSWPALLYIRGRAHLMLYSETFGGRVKGARGRLRAASTFIAPAATPFPENCCVGSASGLQIRSRTSRTATYVR